MVVLLFKIHLTYIKVQKMKLKPRLLSRHQLFSVDIFYSVCVTLTKDFLSFKFDIFVEKTPEC